MDNNSYELLEHGVVTKRFFSFQRMQEYLKENFPNMDLAFMRKHGYVVREVANADK